MELSPGEVGDEDEEIGEEGIGSTLESYCNDSDEGDGGIGGMMLRTTEVEKNQMGKPMVSPGKDNVSIYIAPMFPKEGNRPGFPFGGIPWLVDSGNVVIKNKHKKHSYFN